MTGIFMTCGIYLLTFSSDKTYIGLSNNIEKRISGHLLSLKKKIHINSKLQEAYNQLSIPKIEIIDECSESELIDSEISAFDLYNPTLNIALAGGYFPINKGEDNAHSEYDNDIILSALLYVYENPLKPIKQIAVDIGLHYSTLKNICNGQGHKWLKEVVPEQYNVVLNTKRTAKITKYPNVISPQGVEYTVHNATEFARQYDLNQGAFAQLLLGKHKSHHGWKIK